MGISVSGLKLDERCCKATLSTTQFMSWTESEALMAEKTRLSIDNAKETWDCNNFSLEGDRPCGLSWPPRYYTCSFCRRKFKSAQALGGHMNVHRRDRARLRQSPSWVNEFPNPNPNPNFSSSSSSWSPPAAMFPPFTYTRPSLLSPSLTGLSSPSSASTNAEKLSIMVDPRRDPLCTRGGDLTKMKNMRAVPAVGELKGFAEEDEFKVLKMEETIKLDLQIGFVRDPEEDLDLELRLGYS